MGAQEIYDAAAATNDQKGMEAFFNEMAIQVKSAETFVSTAALRAIKLNDLKDKVIAAFDSTDVNKNGLIAEAMNAFQTEAYQRGRNC